MTHVEPDDDEENEIGDGNMGDLEFCPGLMIEVEVTVDPSKFDEVEIHEVQQ